MYTLLILTVIVAFLAAVINPLHALEGLPEIREAPRNQAVRRGATAYFVCRAECHVYRWMKNGRLITFGDDPYTYFGIPGGYVLRIEESELGRDNTHYQCEAIIFGEPTVTVEASLYIYDNDEIPPGFPNITESPSADVEVEKGGTAILKCGATGDPAPRFWWLKNRKPFFYAENTRYAILNTTLSGDTLKIEGFVEDDAGSYQCVAENDIGTEFSQPRNFKVLRDPLRFLTVPPPLIEVQQGADLNVTCEAAADPANPKPVVKWWKNPSTQITPDDPQPIGKTVLELKRIQKTTIYTCQAQSGSSSVETMTKVSVISSNR